MMPSGLKSLTYKKYVRMEENNSLEQRENLFLWTNSVSKRMLYIAIVV